MRAVSIGLPPAGEFAALRAFCRIGELHDTKEVSEKQEQQVQKKDIDAVEIATRRRHLFLLEKLKNSQILTAKETDELTVIEKKTGSKKQSKSAIAAEQVIRTQAAAAKYAGVDDRTIRRWVKNKMPRTGEGHYIKSMLDFYKSNSGSQTTDAKKRGGEAEANLKETKSQLLSIELKLKQGQLVPIEDLEKQRITRITVVRRALMNVGRKLAPQLAVLKEPRLIQAKIDSEMEDIVNTFAGEQGE